MSTQMPYTGLLPNRNNNQMIDISKTLPAQYDDTANALTNVNYLFKYPLEQ